MASTHSFLLVLASFHEHKANFLRQITALFSLSTGSRINNSLEHVRVCISLMVLLRVYIAQVITFANNRLFFLPFFVDIALVNGFLLFKELHHEQKRITLSEFKVMLARKLLESAEISDYWKTVCKRSLPTPHRL